MFLELEAGPEAVLITFMLATASMCPRHRLLRDRSRTHDLFPRSVVDEDMVLERGPAGGHSLRQKSIDGSPIALPLNNGQSWQDFENEHCLTVKTAFTEFKIQVCF